MDRVSPRSHLWMTEQLGIFPDPPERATLAKALRNLAVNFENDIVKRVFVPVEARELPVLLDTFRPVRQLMREITGVSSGGDSADAQISAMSKRSKRVRNLLSTLKRSPTPVILLGDPGAGKSLTLQQVAVVYARQQERCVYPGFCVFIQLGRWTPTPDGSQTNETSVRKLIFDACPEPIRPYLKALEQQRRLTIIFDGMDEMSRNRYLEHTNALNAYAGATEGHVRTLFSCRIADFAPNFSHSRLVLMPFDSAHIRTFLRLQFGDDRVNIDGKRITIDELIPLLISDDLPVRAANPFVLYLLSLYMIIQKKLPSTRTELLGHYFKYSIAREGPELEARGLNRQWHSLFDLWARVAFSVTEANRGSLIRRVDVDFNLGPAAEEAIRSGQIVGAIEEIADEDPDASRLIRFDSHRVQEYFTAWAIAKAPEAFQWTNKLDVPRWQETLVNVAQMNAADNAISSLEETLEAVPALTQRSAEPGHNIRGEAEAAERIDLAARVLRSSDRRNRLKTTIRNALISQIGTKNGFSMASALRTIQKAPELGDLELTSPTLASKSGWVRDQAYVVASTLPGADSVRPALGEVRLAFSENSLLERLPRYLSLARRLKSRRLKAETLVGALMQLTSFIAAACAPAVFLFI
jgi:hypothetical protein